MKAIKTSLPRSSRAYRLPNITCVRAPLPKPYKASSQTGLLPLPKLSTSLQSIINPPAKQQLTQKVATDVPQSAELPWDLIALVGLSTAVAFICSIDRAAMSVAILPMSQQFDWDDGVKGTISSAFFVGYMITNVTGGYLATRYSAKGVLALGVVLWSCFTMATPFAASSGNLNELIAARGLMGVGEGVAYPSIQNLVRRWVPADSRSRALAFIYSGHQLGTIASYIAAPIIISKLGWESVFWVFGGLGFVWLLGWGPLVSDAPKAELKDAAVPKGGLLSMFKKSETNAVEPLKWQDIPWKEIASNKPFWAIVGAQVTVGIGSCLSFSWLPTFYSEVYGVDVTTSAAFSVVPFIGTVLATNAAGWIADGMVNNGVLTKTQTRKLMQAVASLGPAACLLKLASDQGVGGGQGLTDAVVMITAWLALGGFSAAGYGSNHQDISGKWAGVLFGLSNGLASIAGSASIYATGMVLHQTHDWSLIFSAAAVMYLLGAGAYLVWASADEQFADDGKAI